MTRLLSPFQLLEPLFQQEDNWMREQVAAPDHGLSISEDDTHVIVEAALPGLTPEQIEVVYQKGVLWVKGEKREEEKDKSRKYYKRAKQSFSYSISIPGKIDEAKEPEASYKHGVMEVRFTKATSDAPRRIQVKAC